MHVSATAFFMRFLALQLVNLSIILASSIEVDHRSLEELSFFNRPLYDICMQHPLTIIAEDGSERYNSFFSTWRGSEGHLKMFNILGTVGGGATSTLSKAFLQKGYIQKDNDANLVFAIKHIRRPSDLQYARNEECFLGSIRHPNVPTFYFAMSALRGAYLVMQYLDGYSVDRIAPADRRHEISQSSKDIISSFWPQVLEAGSSLLSLVHSNGIVIRDVKDENVFITQDAKVYFVDFGMAMTIEKASEVGACGSPIWMAPEHIESSAQSDPSLITDGFMAADWYALGAVIFVMIMQQIPFRADTTLTECRNQIERGISFGRLPNNRDQSVLLQGLMHIDPSKRFTHREVCLGMFVTQGKIVSMECLIYLQGMQPAEIANEWKSLRRKLDVSKYSDSRLSSTSHIQREAHYPQMSFSVPDLSSRGRTFIGDGSFKETFF